LGSGLRYYCRMGGRQVSANRSQKVNGEAGGKSEKDSIRQGCGQTDNMKGGMGRTFKILPMKGTLGPAGGRKTGETKPGRKRQAKCFPDFLIFHKNEVFWGNGQKGGRGKHTWVFQRWVGPGRGASKGKKKEGA